MGAKVNYFKIGLFVIITLVIGMIMVMVLGVSALLEKKTIIETYIDGSVQGIAVGSEVKFRGVPIGKVSEINVVSWVYPTKFSYILVRMSCPANQSLFKGEEFGLDAMKTETEKGLRCRLATKGVTGSAYVEVDYLDPDKNPPLKIDWKPMYPYLPSAPSVITQLSDSLTAIMNNLEAINLKGIAIGLQDLLDSLNTKLSGADVKGVSDQAEALLVELRTTNRQLQKLVAGVETESLFNDARSTLGSAKSLIDDSKKPVADFLTTLNKTTSNLNQLSGRLNRTSKDLPGLVNQLQNTLVRLDNLLYAPQADLEEAMENIKIISNNLKELSEDSKRYPAYLFFGKPPRPVQPGARQ